MNLEEIEEELVEIPLTEHEWDMVAWLIAEVKRLREENRELIDKYLEIGYLVKTISDILEGKEPSDFMLSYPLVREVADKVSEVKRLRGQIVKKDKRIERIKLLIEQAISIIESAVLDPSWPEVLAQKACNKKWIERAYDESGRD